jgi:hypothetical protein
MHILGKGLRPFATIVLALIASAEGARAQDKPCDRTSVSPCACDLTQLRPLQGAVGEQEVQQKAQVIAKNPRKARSGLESDPIKVILGYGGHLYIVDHHHGAKAWVESAEINPTIKRKKWIENSVCQVMNTTYVLPFDYKSEDEFWNTMQTSKRVWLKNANGAKITPDQLPKTVADLPDDPYRNFARTVEKNHGFCKFPESADFLEFMWADAAFRSNPSFPREKLGDNNLVQTGVNEARDPKYKCAVPGWTPDGGCSTQPTCPSNP